MAHIVPNQGLSAILSAYIRNGPLAVTYVGGFLSQTSGTVPSRTASGAASPVDWTEVTGDGYARRVISAAAWGVPTVNGNGVNVTGAQQAWTATGAWSVMNGYFLATNSASHASDRILQFANFDGLSAYTLASGDIFKVTPEMQPNVSAGA